MEQRIVGTYDRQLNRISEAIVEMGELVKELVQLASEALQHPDTNFVAQARKTDKQVNQLDKEVEKLATTVLALRQPMAVDLRIVSSSLKMCGYLEGMGDLAKSAIKKAAQPDIALPHKALKDFSEVAQTIVEMVEDVLDAFETRNAEKAKAVWKRDDDVDELYRDLYNRLQKRMQEEPNHIPSYMRILFAAKNFERIGDYVTRLAATVYYIVTGERFDKKMVKDLPVEPTSEPA